MARAAGASLRAYPNPATADAVTLAGLPPGATAVRLTDGLGRVVLAKALPLGTASATLDIAGVPPGFYVLTADGPSAASARVLIP